MNAKQKKPRYTLRTLFVLLTICAFWLAYQTNHARRQRIAVQTIESSGGRVRYDYQRTAADPKAIDASAPGPSWLRHLVGDDFFRRVVEVDWNGKQVFTSEELEVLEDLPKLDTLNFNFSGVDDSNLSLVADLSQLKELGLEQCSGVTDEGLGHVSRLSNLEYLALLATNCSDDGVEQYIPKLTRLKYLDLVGIPVSNDTARRLTELKDLNFVHLGRVGHRAKYNLRDAVTSIKAALPNCTVNYWGPETEER